MATYVLFDDGTMKEMTEEQSAAFAEVTEEEAAELAEFDRYEEIFWSVDPAIRPYIERIKDRRIRVDIWGVVNHVIRYAYQAGRNDAAEGS